MRVGYWLQSLLFVTTRNQTHAKRRRTSTRQTDQTTPFAAQVLQLEARVMPAVIVVTTTADTINADDGVISLREAVIQANTTAGDDTILLGAGTYTLTRTGDFEQEASTGDLDILNNGTVTIVGAGANQTTISAAGLGDRVFQVKSGATLIMSGVTITGGTGTFGGGIENYGTVFLTEVAIVSNSAVNGGGISSAGTLTMTRSTLSGNSALGSGGGIQSPNGGIITVSNSTISGNSANEGGGGIATVGSSLTISNSTITGNRADSDGNQGQMGFAGGVWDGSTVATITNSIIAGNFVGTGTTTSDVAASLSGTSVYNLIGDAGSAGGLINGANGNIVGVSAANVLDPFLSNNGGLTQTHRLYPWSIAINAGDPSVNSGLDQRGFSRVKLGRLDIGAVEADSTAPILHYFSPETIFSKKAAKRNGAPQIVPDILVDDLDVVPAADLGGGVLTFSLDMQGKQHKKKGFLSYDTIGGLSNAQAIGTILNPLQSGGRVYYTVLLNSATTEQQVQSFLRGLTFTTKGKGTKIGSRQFEVFLKDAAESVSDVLEQTILVSK